jgi:hypothetical protein
MRILDGEERVKSLEHSKCSSQTRRDHGRDSRAARGKMGFSSFTFGCVPAESHEIVKGNSHSKLAGSQRNPRGPCRVVPRSFADSIRFYTNLMFRFIFYRRG